MDEAFEALLEERLPLAEKLARRSVAGGEMNPRLWLDLGRILVRCGQREDAEQALRRAIALAPNYAEAFAELAAFQAAVGKWPQAERLQRRAVELRPDDADARAKLASYAAMIEPRDAEAADDEPAPSPTALTQRFDWTAVAGQLRAHGVARLERLLAREQCAALRDLWGRECFEYGESFDGDDLGLFECRAFAAPLPPFVQRLREEVYAQLAPIADSWQQLLGRRLRFPPSLAGFQRRCAEVAQRRPGPCLLRFPIGGHRAPHRDLRQLVVFPFQLAVPLGPEVAPGTMAGATLRLLDVRGTRKRREHAFPAEPGCGLVFAATERLVEIAGVVAVQPVEHGFRECAVDQFVLSVPFHDIG